MIICTGIVKDSKIARNGFEIIPDSITVLSASATPLPLDPRGITDANLDTRFEWRTLDLRRPETTALFKVEAALIYGMESYLRQEGFIQVFTPSILGGISEGGSEVFKIDFYGKPTFLRQDPQLHRQLAMAGGLGRVYDLGANWRAELSHTPRHMSEHRTIAPEMSFVTDERDTMHVEEGMIVSAIRSVLGSCTTELELLKVSLEEPKTPFPELRVPGDLSPARRPGAQAPRGLGPGPGVGEAPERARKERVRLRLLLRQPVPFEGQAVLRHARGREPEIPRARSTCSTRGSSYRREGSGSTATTGSWNRSARRG